MKRVLILILLLSTTLLAGWFWINTRDVDQTELVVYGAVIDNMLDNEVLGSNRQLPLPIENKTRTSWKNRSFDPRCFGSDRPPNTVLWSYRLKSLIQHSIPTSVPSNADLIYINNGREEAPYDYLVFSRVGFNFKRDQAVVYVSRYCPLCGIGVCLYLIRENDQWIIKSGCTLWVS